MKTVFLKKKVMYCPYCDCKHAVVLKTFKEKGDYKDIEIEYRVKAWQCRKQHKYFETGKELNKNLANMRKKIKNKGAIK